MNLFKLKKIFVFMIVIIVLGISFIIPGFSSPLSNHKLETSRGNYNNMDFKNNGDTLFVGGGGPGNYSNIQEAVDNAKNGDTIFVYIGSYPANIVVDKSLSIIGEDRDSTIVRGGQDGFFIYSDKVKITNLTIRECGEFWNHAAIYLESNDNTLINIKIIDNGKLNALFLKGSNNNSISNNFIENNPYHSIRMEYSNYNIFTNNFINNNQGDGLFIVESSDNYFELNTISLNFWGGITIDEYSENNKFIHNNLIDNSQNANDNGRNIWNNSYPSGGNYWSDYAGIDQFQGPEQDIPGADGIGDTPYDLPCEHAVDWYPLMMPYSAPYSPVINGQTNGKIGIEYVYTFFVDDLDKDDLFLRVDWGTGIPSRWYGPYPSGTDVKLNYTWYEKGRFLIKAQAKDINNLEGEWGSLDVSIPRDTYHNIFLFDTISEHLLSKIIKFFDLLSIIF